MATDPPPIPVRTLTVTLTPSATQFAADAGTWLEAHPVDANVVATVLAGILAGHAQYDDQSWALVREDDPSSGTAAGHVAGAAMQTAPHPAYVPAVGEDVAVALADAWHAAGRRLPGVNGDAVATRAFAARWAEVTRARPRLGMQQGVYLLGTLVPPSGVAGRVRPTEPADAPLAQAWLRAFMAEAEPNAPLQDDLEHLRHRLARGQLLFWEVGGEAVSMAGWRPPAAGVGRVGPVYTPPEHRRRGYAAAVTAAASRAVLDAGARECMLFTDLANPTSNGVYVRLGYQRVGESAQWRFEEDGTV